MILVYAAFAVLTSTILFGSTAAQSSALAEVRGTAKKIGSIVARYKLSGTGGDGKPESLLDEAPSSIEK